VVGKKKVAFKRSIGIQKNPSEASHFAKVRFAQKTEKKGYGEEENRRLPGESNWGAGTEKRGRELRKKKGKLKALVKRLPASVKGGGTEKTDLKNSAVQGRRLHGERGGKSKKCGVCKSEKNGSSSFSTSKKGGRSVDRNAKTSGRRFGSKKGHTKEEKGENQLY